MEKIFNSLLFKVFCGIALGILLGNYAPDWLYRILITFKTLFANFLNFSIPLIMIGLIMPSIFRVLYLFRRRYSLQLSIRKRTNRHFGRPQPVTPPLFYNRYAAYL